MLHFGQRKIDELIPLSQVNTHLHLIFTSFETYVAVLVLCVVL